MLRSAYYCGEEGRGRGATVGNGKGVYCWALAFVLFAVLSVVSAAAKSAAAACLYYSLSLLLLLLQLCFGFWFNAFDLNT